MEHTPNIQLRHLEGWLGNVAYQYTHVQFSSGPLSETWAPAINAYRCKRAFIICVDLAGLERAEIELRVEPRKLWVQGRRRLPEPAAEAGPPMQVLAMEIDHGPFAREIVLPEEVEPGFVRAEQRHGLLWVSLPLRSPDE